MSAIYLTEVDVQQLADMPLALDAVREAFRQLGSGGADNVPRVRAKAPGIVLHSLSATASYLGFVGWKIYTTTRAGAQFLVGLHDAATGRCLALIEGDYLGQLRTGATTGVAAEWLALPRASEIGVFGAGRQARTQLEAVAAVRPLKMAYVYSRTAANRQKFADEMSARLDIEVRPVDRPQEAAEELPIVVTGHQQRHAGVRRPMPGRGGRWSARSAAIGPRGPRSTRTSCAGPTTSFATARRLAASRRGNLPNRWLPACSIGTGRSIWRRL